jgi:hypothetical protein
MNLRYHCIVLILLTILSQRGWSKPLPDGCYYNKRCVIELPESRCADGSSSFFSLIARENSEELVIYLEPGGACWNKKTCDLSHVQTLTRKDPKKVKIPESGLMDLDNSDYPFFNQSIVTIPYCTGDVFLGNNQINYGTEENPHIIHHRGFNNVVLAFERIREYFPIPSKVTLFGRSAGGLGVLGHIRNLNSYFPNSDKFAISDAGTPLSPPFVNEQRYQEIMTNWNVASTLPTVDANESMNHFGDLLNYNIKHFPQIRFGYIQSYDDPVMTYFAKSIGSPNPSETLKQNVIAAADLYIGRETPHAKVFFLHGKTHVVTKKSLKRTKSIGISLYEWVNELLSGRNWSNVRPDLKSY